MYCIEELSGILKVFLIYSCKTAKVEASKEVDNEQLIIKSESYFKATGNEPFWSLEISENSTESPIKSPQS